MKYCLLLVSLLYLSGLSAQPTGNLIVFAEQGEKFWLILNGVKQNAEAQTNVKVTGLNAPNYKGKIIFENNNLPDLDKDIFLSQPDIDVAGEYTYNIKKNKEGKYVLRYVSAVPIAQAAPPSAGQAIVIYGSAPPVGAVTTTTTTTTTTSGEQINVGMNVGGVNAGVSINVNDGGRGVTHTQTTHTTSTTHSAPAQVIYVHGYTGPIGCPVPMDQQAFSSAKRSIADASFESTKSDITKSVISRNCFTSDQALEIVQLFDFESTRLEIAKQMYPKVYDKGNYYKVNDAFEFDSSKSELSQFIGKY